MQCLYCGKHLPLFRKLTGNGEFCSDSHRDSYHEEYNRLAVNRLLQAQTRTDDPKPALEPPPVERMTQVAIAEAPEVEEQHAAAVAVAEKPELEAAAPPPADFLPGDRPILVARFQNGRAATATFESEVEPEVISNFEFQPELGPLPIPNGFCAPLTQATFVPFPHSPRRISLPSAEMALPSNFNAGQTVSFPEEERAVHHQFTSPRAVTVPPVARSLAPPPIKLESASWRPAKHFIPHPPPEASLGSPVQGRAVALPLPPVRQLSPQARTMSLTAIECPSTGPVIPVISFSFRIPEAQRPGRLRIPLLSIGPDADAQVEIAALQDFPDLGKPQSVFEIRIKLLDMGQSIDSEEAQPDVAPVTPRRALQALSQLHAERKKSVSQAPQRSIGLKPIVIVATTPGAETLAAGFESIVFESKPRLLRFSTQPLRPKMAIGTPAGPLTVPSGGPRVTPMRNPAHAEQARNGTSRKTARSMLHLEDDDRAAETENEAPSLFGKLGGFFGKKSRNGK